MTSTLRSQRLLQWFLEQGGHYHPDVELTEDAEFGIQVRAKVALSLTRNEHSESIDSVSGGYQDADHISICTCPMALSMSILNVNHPRPGVPEEALAVRTDVAPAAAQLVTEVPEHVVAYFILMEQKLLGERSFWFPYIQSLPAASDLTTPLYFANEDLEWLVGTRIHSSSGKSAIEERRLAWSQQWKGAVEILTRKNIDVADFTFDLFLWAATIFTSRSFTSSAAFSTAQNHFAILYPGVDILNHSAAAKVAWNFCDGNFTVSIRESVMKGAQVFNNYAPKGNEELLMGMGFALDNNPSDEVSVTLPPAPPPVHEILRKRLPERFQSENWSSEDATFYIRGSSHHSGGYEHGISCLRGVPYPMFRMMAELVYHMATGHTDGAEEALHDEDFFDFVIEQFLNPLRAKRAAIPALAKTPQNAKQRFAKIYRDGQINIMDQVISALEGHLKERKLM